MLHYNKSRYCNKKEMYIFIYGKHLETTVAFQEEQASVFIKPVLMNLKYDKNTLDNNILLKQKGKTNYAQH